MSADENQLTCRGCGAKLVYRAGTASLHCQYCGVVTAISQPKAPPHGDAPLDDNGLVVPLSVEPQVLQNAVYRLMAGNRHAPDNLLEEAVITKTSAMYVPMYSYQGQYEAQWTASFGYDREEQFTVYESRTENGYTRQVPVTKTKTVTDWRPVSGTDTGHFSVLAYAGEGLPERVPELLEHTPGVEKLTDYADAYVSGLDIESFAAQEGEVYERRGRALVNQAIDSGVERHAQGDRQRDWHWTASISKTARATLVPVCHVRFEFEGKAYDVWVDGTDPDRMVSDPLPRDASRKSAAERGYWFAWAATLAVPAAGLAFKGKMWSELSLWTGALVAATWGLAYLHHNAVLAYSERLKQHLLTQRTSAGMDSSRLDDDTREAMAEHLNRPSRSWLADPGTSLWVFLALLGVLAGVMLFQNASVRLGGSGRPAAVAVTPAPARAPAAPSAGAVAAFDTDAVIAIVRAAGAMDWPEADRLVAELKARPSPVVRGDRPAAREANARGLDALRNGDPNAAVVAFRQATSADAGDVEARSNLGFAYLRAGQPAEAVNTLLEVLVLAPDRANAWGSLAHAAANIGKAGGAKSALRLALRHSSNRARTLAFLQQPGDALSPQFREVIADVLPEVDAIPRSPRDS